MSLSLYFALVNPLTNPFSIDIPERGISIKEITYKVEQITFGHFKMLICKEKPKFLNIDEAADLTLWRIEGLSKGNNKWAILEEKKYITESEIIELGGKKLPSNEVVQGSSHVTTNSIIIVQPPTTSTRKRKAEDSNEELGNKKVKQIELTPESISRFLERQEGVKDDFTKPHRLCRNKFDFQRKGRDQTLHKTYDCIVDRYIIIKKTLERGLGTSDKDFHPVLALQATSGGGKSFFLDELVAFKREDFDNYLKSREQSNRKYPFYLENTEYYSYVKAVIDMLHNSIGVCITYNGHSSYNYNRFVDDDVERGLVMRILWSYFFDDNKLSWKDFCEKFSTSFESLGIFTAVKSILYHSKKRVFLCIDETMKILSNTDTNRRQDKVNELLNNLYNPYQGLVKDKEDLIKFNFILTTFDAVYVQANTTASGRIINWMPLRRLEISESIELFHEILNDNELDQKRKYLIRKCISDCNGHPRTLEKFYQLLHEDGTALRIDIYSSLLSRLVDKIISWFSCITFSVIKTALLGNSINLKHKINTFNEEFSISDLISSGVYINSLTEDKDTINVVPTLTLISLQYFCTNNVEEGDAKIVVKILQDILLTEFHFDDKVMDGKAFKSFHYNWELLYRVLREEGKEVSLREVYSLSDTTTKGNVKIILQRKNIIKLDSDVEFPPHDGKIYDEQGDLIKNFGGYIFVPEKTNNSGFDMTIFEKKVGGGHIVLNIECRFFYPRSSTTLGNKEIREKYKKMVRKYRYHVKQEKNQNATRKQRKDSEVVLVNSDTPIGEFGMTMEDIYLVIIAWRDIVVELDSDIKNNKNIIIVGRDSLENAYTPSLVTRPQFYDSIFQTIMT